MTLAYLLQKDWETIVRHLHIRFPELRDEDLIYVPGQEAELIRRLERKTGLSEIELTKFVEDALLVKE